MIHSQTVGFYLDELVEICAGELYEPELNKQMNFQNFEVSSSYLLPENKQENVFIVVTKERWNEGQFYEMSWGDRVKEAQLNCEKLGLVITEQPIAQLKGKVAQLLVKDSLESMRIISRAAREKMTNPVIAITGTVGKSTMTLMIEHVAKQPGKLIVKNRGNHNTNRGVPMYAIGLARNPDLAIMEMSLNALGYAKDGKKRSVSEDLKPTHVIFTSAGIGHMLGRDTTTHTATAKSRIFRGIDQNGIAIINRDLADFALVEGFAREKTDQVLTYSLTGQEDADLRVTNVTYLKDKMQVEIAWKGQNLTYDLGIPSLGMVETSLGCLLMSDQLAIPFETFQERMLTFKPTEKVMAEKQVKTLDDKRINILDDTHNAAIPSMINLIDVFAEKKKFYKGKKILVLGQINELGVHAMKHHRGLVEHIENAKPDFVFLYGYLMQEVAKELPKSIPSAWYTTMDDLIQGIHSVTNEDAYIAMKGSVSGSDFQEISEKLPQFFTATKLTKAKKVNLPKLTNKMLVDLQNPDWQLLKSVQHGHTGLSHLVVIYEALRLAAQNKLALRALVEVSTGAAEENRAAGSIGLKAGETLTLHKLITLAANFNAPDAIIALAHFIFKGKSAGKEINRIGKALGIDEFALKNVTGRAVKFGVQRYSATDLVKLLRAYSELPKNALSLLQAQPLEHHGRLLVPVSKLQQKGVIYGGLFWGVNHTEGVAFVEKEGCWHAAIAVGMRNHFDRDAGLMSAIDGELTPIKPEKLKIQSSIINILGDTYFGEDYTMKRQKNGRKDALTEHGYSHSFKKISTFFKEDAFNLFNFEAVFIEEGQPSNLSGIKGFLLGASKEQTINELLKNHVSAVTLATNHTLDYGNEPLKNTVKAFRDHDVLTLGAGASETEAYKPLVLTYNDKKVAIFNAYWYRNPPYIEYDFYTLGKKPGVACLSGRILDEIKLVKQTHPTTKVLVVAHWGADFKEVLPEQQNVAKRLIECGADFIIGHGPHMMQRIGIYNKKPIVYSIGNGVFNSDGEYKKHNQLAYSFITRICLIEQTVKLYPIYCNNLETFWQPHFVTDEQILEVQARHQEWGSIVTSYKKDEDGYYFELPF